MKQENVDAVHTHTHTHGVSLMDNYKLKLELMYHGIKIKEEYSKLFNNFLFTDYITTSGMKINYDDIYVNVRINGNSKYQLIHDGSWKIVQEKEVLADNIKMFFPPLYTLNNAKLENGDLVTEYVNTHMDRIRIQPINGCNNKCSFCTLSDESLEYIKHDIDKLDRCFNIAMQKENGPVRHALISGGSPKDCIEDYEYLTNVYTHFATKYKDFEFDIMMAPRGFKAKNDTEDYKNYIKYLDDIGIHGLSINIELYNKEYMKKYAYKKYEIGLDNYIKFLKDAVEVMGTNRVRSCIIVGLEPIEDTIKGVELLCSIGCMPVLSPYIPCEKIDVDRITVEDMLKVRRETEKIAQKYNVPIGPLCNLCSYNTI